MFMFHDGRVKDNLNFKQICPLKQKEHTVRITYESAKDLDIYQYDDDKDKMIMNEDSYYAIGCHSSDSCYNDFKKVMMYGGGHRTLLRSGKQLGDNKVGFTKVPWNWEILKIFFIEYNIKPIWHPFSQTFEFTQLNTTVNSICDEETGLCWGMMGKVIF